jgi:hypothetical protein
MVKAEYRGGSIEYPREKPAVSEKLQWAAEKQFFKYGGEKYRRQEYK